MRNHHRSSAGCIADLRDRMPIVVPPDVHDRWLDPEPFEAQQDLNLELFR
jgi:putative SOS response-associated peptidase YedK